ncbi:MAG TPA: hypothetical protein VGV14_03450 [Rhodanobacter sp.]|nr:hypothetical protein [Rhodanobacter sp.]
MNIQFAELPVFNPVRAKKVYADHFGCRIAAGRSIGKNEWR